MKIETDVDAINFLYYLATIKQYDSLSLVRVVERPDLMGEVYNQFVKEGKHE